MCSLQDSLLEMQIVPWIYFSKRDTEYVKQLGIISGERHNRAKGPPGEEKQEGRKVCKGHGRRVTAVLFTVGAFPSPATKSGTVDHRGCTFPGIRQLLYFTKEDSWCFWLQRSWGEREWCACWKRKEMCKGKSCSVCVAGRDLVSIVLWLLWWQCIFNDIIKWWYSFL